MWYKYAMSKIIDNKLYHTTSIDGLIGIIETQTINANPFVSFSANPEFYNDINGNDIIIVFNANNLKNNLMEVLYNEKWYKKFPDHANYIAGEGWIDQYYFEPSEYIDDDEYDELYEQDYDLAAQQAFESKSDENEWISILENNPIKFNLDDILFIIVKDNKIRNIVEQILLENNIKNIDIKNI